MDGSVIFFFAAVIIMGAVLLAIIGFNKKGRSHLNTEYYRTQWLKIENHLLREDLSSHQMCIINADKLVDHALRSKGLRGKTMGDRMKLANKTFTNSKSVWSAHKLRNKIAHEAGVTVSYEDARYALSGFKQALKDLGAI